MDPLLKRITTEPGKLGGRPTVRGMRIGVVDILQMLGGGMTQAEILADYDELEPDDIAASLAYAVGAVAGTSVVVTAV